MAGYRPIGGNLIYADLQQAFLLTLAFTLIVTSTFCHAAENYTEIEKQRINDVETYIRKESLQGVSLLPGEVKTAIGWLSGSWHAMSLMGGVETNDQPEAHRQAASPNPLGPNLQGNSDGSPIDIASNFHHKGFLPTHDAMVMGMGVSQSAFDSKLKFTAHPFYGQNWRSLQGYWGTELTMDIVKRADDLPSGKISLGYVQGNESLTDRGRGIDLHGDVDLTEGWKFTSGIRQNSADGDSNYVMLRWHLGFN